MLTPWNDKAMLNFQAETWSSSFISQKVVFKTSLESFYIFYRKKLNILKVKKLQKKLLNKVSNFRLRESFILSSCPQAF